jgi:hypothetical protein
MRHTRAAGRAGAWAVAGLVGPAGPFALAGLLDRELAPLDR